MEWSYTFYLLSLSFTLLAVSSITLLLYCRRKTTSGNRHRLPPGPPGWPVFGNLFDLASPSPHRTLAEFRNNYGDVVWLRLGAIDTIVILSAAAASELFRLHDLAFADRTVTETSQANDYHKGSIALAPYGARWRAMRRLVAVEMLAGKRIEATAGIRRRCVDDMLTWISDAAITGGEGGVLIGRFVFLMSFNLLGNLMLSRDLVGPESAAGSEFFAAMEGVMKWGGHANVADVFPWLRWADPQRLRRKMERDLGKAMKIVSHFVEERMKSDKCDEDFLDVLLAFEGNGKDEPHKISDRDLNIFILEIFMAGSETTSSTIEWAMTELLRNPKTMLRAKAELNEKIGLEKSFEESDIEKLPYLSAVIKETLRLHPPIPLLVPRRAIADTVFMGHFVPKNTQVFVNAWAIGRDPDAWPHETLGFEPGRFLGSGADFRGQNFGLIPFGAGRRMCAGIPLAHRTLSLALGSLLHHFDWQLPEGIDPASVNMRDRLGITIRKFEPLLVVPSKSRIIS